VEIAFQVDESLIEEKLRKLLPGLVAKVKTEIEEEQSERSRIYDKDQPLIFEEEISSSEATREASKPKEEEKKIPEESKKVIHLGYNCDGCGKKNIEGIRYKCAVCADFDYCEECEASKEHVHPFLKIRNLQQNPIKILAVVRDEQNNFEVHGHKIPADSGLDHLLERGMGFLSAFLGGQQPMCRPNPCMFRRPQPQPQQQNGFDFLKTFIQSNLERH
jgi:hypothetical protein